MTDFEAYLGLPWKSGGRDRGGFDCWGLLRFFYMREYHILLPTYATAEGVLTSKQVASCGELLSAKWSEIGDPIGGDAVAIGRKNDGFSHVGVYVECPFPSILHISEGRPSTVMLLRRFEQQGYTSLKYYRHEERNLS